MKQTNCQHLAARIQKMQPTAEPREVARLCLLLSNFIDDFDRLADDAVLWESWRDMGIRVQAATDQHAAMTEELEALASSDPKKFTPEQIWILVRAIKVQSQVLQLYVGRPQLEV